jgi:MoaA/NifB/PqqE/SkfB family radical SAM enzyme
MQSFAAKTGHAGADCRALHRPNGRFRMTLMQETTPGSTFSYRSWSDLLQEIVTDSGKVDYGVLAEKRDLLDRFVGELGSASPDSRPDLFPANEDRLAYWINAYNAFTLHAIMAEYPLTSVWKTKDGQFFQRRRHIAGGHAVSLDDIEHEILRGKFAEPRIHFAINCGSNGCPAMRPGAYEGNGLRDTLRRATEEFLGSEWNCRVDHDARRIYISRIFKMYAQDFSGEHGSTTDYRAGVLRFVAAHTDLPLETIADYEVVYNTYDWGLNDVHREPHLGPILFHEPVEHFADGDGELRELHLYEGNFCNRACEWCTINGSPQGWYRPYAKETLEQAARSVARDGNIKFYGGEPTLHAEVIIEAMRELRRLGFDGLFTIFSNGVKADRLIEILESDRRSEAVLNYSIYHGRDAEPLPAHAREKLEAWARQEPNRVFQGYKILFHAGAGADEAFDRDREADFHGLGRGCVRCFPVLTSKGRFHACPFAAEIDAEHFDLGAVGTDPQEMFQNYQAFRRWIDDVLDPEARRRGVTSCEMCHKHLQELPLPHYPRGAGSGQARPAAAPTP